MKKLTICSVLVFVCVYCSANDGYFGGAGDTVWPLQNSDIEMVSEDIRIKRADNWEKPGNYWEISCKYVFKNNGNKTSISIGFPDSGGAGDSHSDFAIKNFSTWINGEKAGVIIRKGIQTPSGDGWMPQTYARVFMTGVSFEAGETKVITHSYGMDRSQTYKNQSSVDYILRTGALWKNKIGHARITIYNVDNTFLAGVRPKDCKVTENSIVWDYREFEPRENIRVEWVNPKLEKPAKDLKKMLRDGTLKSVSDVILAGLTENYIDGLSGCFASGYICEITGNYTGAQKVNPVIDMVPGGRKSHVDILEKLFDEMFSRKKADNKEELEKIACAIKLLKKWKYNPAAAIGGNDLFSFDAGDYDVKAEPYGNCYGLGDVLEVVPFAEELKNPVNMCEEHYFSVVLGTLSITRKKMKEYFVSSREAWIKHYKIDNLNIRSFVTKRKGLEWYVNEFYSGNGLYMMEVFVWKERAYYIAFNPGSGKTYFAEDVIDKFKIK